MKQNIYHFIEKDKLDAVMNPIESSHGLPNECYTHKDYMAFERNKLFGEKWTVIGVASSVPNIGDIKSFSLQGMPLMIIRSTDNQVKVFHNVCSHRGLQIVKDNDILHNQKLLRCPYHSWSYDLNGKLISTPHIGGLNKHNVENFNKKNCALKEVNTSVWLDLIFINLSDKAIDFNQFIEPLKKRWDLLFTEKDQKMIRRPNDYGYFKIETKCNWKFAIENYCESYHLPWVHPELNKYSKLSDHHHIMSDSNIFAGQDTIVYDPQFKNVKKPSCFPNWPSDKLLYAEYIALFPNVMLGIHKDHYFACWLEPVNTDYTIEHMEIYYAGDDVAFSDDYAHYRKSNMELWKTVFSEDLSSIEGMQKGRQSPAFNGGVFSPIMDNPSHQFHKWVVSSLI